MAEQQRATINVSVPTESRDAFYTALATLKAHDGGLFTSASALIVKAVLDTAERLRHVPTPEAQPRSERHTHGE